VYLVEWEGGVMKVGIGIDQRRHAEWIRNGAILYAVVDMVTKKRAEDLVEIPMKVFMSRIGSRAYESADVAPRFLQAKAGYTECFQIDDLDRHAVRGEFDRLARPAWGDPS
jgi:hypothetical protein